jgi:outer membrane receptor protein involved in Fe transport
MRRPRARLGLALAGAFLALAGPAFTFEGRVVLPDGTPAAGATVSILNLARSMPTDARGAFLWQPDPPLPFEVLIVLASGQAMTPVLVDALPAEGPLVVRVLPSVVETVTVTTGAAPHLEAAPASALTTVGREDMEQRHTLRLADLLENIPGAGRLEEGHSVVPSLRGLARGRTLILLDGARVTAERRAGPSATYLDPFFLESLEVARGPGSVAYGSDALGGVIDARTRRPQPGAPLGMRLQGSAGAGLPERSAGLEVSRGLGQGGLIFLARARDFDDYRSPGGEVFNSSATDRGYLLRLNQAAGPGILTVGWESDFGRDIGKPDETSNLTRAFYPREDSNRLTAAYDFQPGGGFTQAGLSGFVGTYRLVLDRDRLPTTTEPRLLQRSDLEARDFGLRASAERPVGSARMRLGLDLNGRFGLHALGSVLDYDLAGDLVLKTEEQAIGDARRTDGAVYASIEAPLAKLLTAAAGLRADQVRTRNRDGSFGDRSTRHGAIAGYGALTAGSFRGLTATVQLARGFRDPTLSDRYFAGISGRGFVTGDPGLGPETSLQADIALRYTRDGLRLGLYAYRYRIEDLIERYETVPGQFFFRNRGLALLRGVEIEAETMTRSGLSVALGAQVASGRALDGNSPLDDSPAPGITLALRQDLPRSGYVLARAAAYRRDHRPGPTERDVPGHGTLDLGGGWRIGRAAEIRLLVRNVTNQEYLATPDAKSVLAPGRTGLATLVLGF